jgi:hypothetical protein
LSIICCITVLCGLIEAMPRYMENISAIWEDPSETLGPIEVRLRTALMAGTRIFLSKMLRPH